jgi:hypothetical protein
MPQLLYPQERTLVPIEQEAGWSPGLVWTVLEKRKSLAPAGIELWTVQLVPVCYTDCAVPASEDYVQLSF